MIKIKKSEYYQIIADANKEIVAIRRRESFLNESRNHFDKGRIDHSIEKAFFKSFEKIKKRLKREVIEEIVNIMKEEEGLLAITRGDADLLSIHALHDVNRLPEDDESRIKVYKLREKYKKEV